MFKKWLAVFAAALLLTGCGSSLKNTEPITEQEYKIALGKAVCSAVDSLNERGLLADQEKFGQEFEAAVKKAVNDMGYSDAEWLAAKQKFFDSTEHEKLIKMHFTWCLIGDSLQE